MFGRHNEEHVVSEVQRRYMLLLQLIARLLRNGCGGLGLAGSECMLHRHLCTNSLNAWAHVPSISGIPCLMEIDFERIYMCINSHNPN